MTPYDQTADKRSAGVGFLDMARHGLRTVADGARARPDDYVEAPTSAYDNLQGDQGAIRPSNGPSPDFDENRDVVGSPG